MRVARRVPQHGVDAVRNGDQVGGALAQQAVQPATECRGQDFAGVGVADGGDAVGVSDAGLHEVQLVPGHAGVLAPEGGGNAESGGIL
ncbi:hypothetical protein D3C81_2054140 [compost metagenome]